VATKSQENWLHTTLWTVKDKLTMIQFGSIPILNKRTISYQEKDQRGRKVENHGTKPSNQKVTTEQSNETFY